MSEERAVAFEHDGDNWTAIYARHYLKILDSDGDEVMHFPVHAGNTPPESMLPFLLIAYDKGEDNGVKMGAFGAQCKIREALGIDRMWGEWSRKQL